MLALRLQIPFILLGVPIRGRRNPYLAMLARNVYVDVSYEVEESDMAECLVEGVPRPPWSVRLALQEFVGELGARLETGLRVIVRYEAGIEPPSAGLYAALTYGLVEAVSREAGYSLSREEVVQAAASIDEDAGVGLDYVDALRWCIMRGGGTVYRRGEGAFDAGVPPVKLWFLGEEAVHGSMESELPEPVASLVTKLVGVGVVEAVSRLRRGGGWGEVLRWAGRVENSVYYLLYGLEPNGEGCKWTPGMQSAAMLCLEAVGEKEGVAVDLV